jgi:hypothetical protein
MSLRFGRIAVAASVLVSGAAQVAYAQPVRLVSRAATGTSATADSNSFLGNGGGASPLGLRMISADGRFVVFSSLADNLVPGQTNTHPFSNVYLRDRQTDTTLLISHKDASPAVSANGPASNPLVSADGCVVAFESVAADLLPGSAGPATSIPQIFVYDCTTGSITLASHAVGSMTMTSDSGCALADLSADGNVVVFNSPADDLVAGGNASGPQVYVFFRQTGLVQLVTRTAASATSSPNDATSGFARVSANGRFVAFGSFASDVIAGFSAPNGRHQNVFLEDLTTGTTQLVSHQAGSSSVAQDNNAGINLSLSSDGRFVAFESSATNLVQGQVDTLGSIDVFLFDRLSGTNVLVSRAAGTTAVAGSRDSVRPLASADGNYVVFESAARDLVSGFVDDNPPEIGDVFLFERVSAINRLVSHTVDALASGNAESFAPVISDDGGRVLFRGYATNLVAGQVEGAGTSGYDAFLFDRATSALQIVSHASTSELRTGHGILSGDFALSGDGRYAAFGSYADDLVAHDDNGGATDVFLFGPATPLAFHTVEPCRAADTRATEGPPIAGGATRDFMLRGKCGVPATAETVAINLTVVSPSVPGYLTLFGAGQIAPLSSNANFSAGQVRANNAIVALGVEGKVSVLAGMAAGQVDVLVDVVGYFE